MHKYVVAYFKVLIYDKFSEEVFFLDYEHLYYSYTSPIHCSSMGKIYFLLNPFH